MSSRTNVMRCFDYLIKDVIYGIIKGLKDSLYGVYSIHVHYGNLQTQELRSQSYLEDSKQNKLIITRKSKTKISSIKNDRELDVRSEIYKCCTYNAITYGISVFLFYYCILQLCKIFLDLTLSADMAGSVWDITKPTLSVLFDTLWTVPLFFIFKVINAFWFQDIANGAYRQRYGRPQAFSISGIGSQISDTVFSIIIQLLFLIQASLMQFVPYPSIALVLSCIHLSLLNSLYSFEYLWCNKGWTLHKRINYIEVNWPYFLGFGMPLSLVTFIFPSLIQSGFVYSVFFPWFIISAMEAPPLNWESSGRPLRLFTLVVWFSSAVTRRAFQRDRRIQSEK